VIETAAGTLAFASWSAVPHGIADQAWVSCPARELVNARSENEALRFATQVQFATGGGAIWARFRCVAHDISTTMSRYKDKVWTEGAVEVFLRPPNCSDLYEFQLSPIGTKRDLRVVNPGGADQFYDDTWCCDGFSGEAQILRDERGDVSGWDALIGVPIASIVPESADCGVVGWRVGAFRWEYNPLELSGLSSHPDLDAHDGHFLAKLADVALV
jgi:hypothetical protein